MYWKCFARIHLLGRNYLTSNLLLALVIFHPSMKRKVDCPKCNEPVRMPGSSDYEKGILPNKQLEQLVDAYTHCRDQMRESLVRLDLLEKEKALGMDNAAGRHKVVREVGKEKESRSSKRVRTMVQKAYSSDSDFDEDDGADDAFACKIPTSRLGVVKQTVPQQGQHQLKRKPTVNYHGLKKQKLAELCRKEGLDTHGNDTELKKRHSDFITLYNSECDSAHPRSVGQLREEIRNKEMAIMVRRRMFECIVSFLADISLSDYLITRISFFLL
jgi:hypothetical protein